MAQKSKKIPMPAGPQHQANVDDERILAKLRQEYDNMIMNRVGEWSQQTEWPKAIPESLYEVFSEMLLKMPMKDIGLPITEYQTLVNTVAKAEPLTHIQVDILMGVINSKSPLDIGCANVSELQILVSYFSEMADLQRQIISDKIKEYQNETPFIVPKVGQA